MKDVLLVRYDYIKRHTDSYIQYFRFRVTRRILMAFIISFIFFFIIYQYWFNKNHVVFPWSSDNKVYFLSRKSIAAKRYNDSNVMRDKAQGPATCLIIIRTADGAFGNRMFLFASAYGLARLHQCNLWVGHWIINDLRTAFLVNINQTKVQLTTDDSLVVNRTDIFGRYSACTLYSDLFQIPFNSTFSRYEMVGFYQAYGYFQKYKEEIAYLFQFNQGVISKNVELVEELFKG